MMRLRKGYLPPGAIIVLAIICLFVAVTIFFNAQLIRNVKKDQSPAPTDETVYTEDSRSANWKTYTNEGYGYSIMYPSDFNVSYQNPNSIVLDGRIGDYQEGSGTLNGISVDLTVADYQNVTEAISAHDQDVSRAKNVNIGAGIPATQVYIKTANLQEDLYMYVQLPQKKVLIIKESWTEKNSEAYTKLATQILSTFRFE